MDQRCAGHEAGAVEQRDRGAIVVEEPLTAREQATAHDLVDVDPHGDLVRELGARAGSKIARGCGVIAVMLTAFASGSCTEQLGASTASIAGATVDASVASSAGEVVAPHAASTTRTRSRMPEDLTLERSTFSQ